MTSLVGIKQNTRILAEIDEGQEEIITRNFIPININIPNTVVAATTIDITSYLAGGAINSSKTINVVGDFKLYLKTNLGTFVLDKNNTPVNLIFDITTGNWIDKNNTVRAYPLDIKKVAIAPKNLGGASWQGKSCAINIEGNIIVIGGPRDTYMGSVWIFKKKNNVWQQDGNKISPPSINTTSLFGQSVAISHNIVVVGSPNYSSTGRVWIYEYINNVWTNTNILLANGSGNNQGKVVAISEDEKTIIESDPYANSNGGQIYIFEKIANKWTHIKTFSGAFEDILGSDISFGRSNNLVAVGSPSIIAGNPTNTAGVVKILKKTVNWAWHSQFPSTPTTDGTGIKVAISQDTVAALTENGHIWIITTSPFILEQKFTLGNVYIDPTNSSIFAGAVIINNNYIYVSITDERIIDIFKKTASGWVKIAASVIIPDAIDEFSAQGESLDAVGNLLLIGAPFLDAQTGGVHLWTIDDVYEWQQTLQGNDYVRSGNFGLSIAISADGMKAIIGGPTRRSVWLYKRNGSNWIEELKMSSSSLSFGRSVGISGDGLAFIVGSFNNNVYIYKNGLLEKKLNGVAESSDISAFFGNSVAMSANGQHIAIGAPFNNSNGTGSIWYYKKNSNVWTKIAGPVNGSGISNYSYLSLGYLYSSFSHSPPNGIAISGDGLTIAAGAGNHASNTGGVWVFYNGVEQAAALQGTGTAGSKQGHFVSLNTNGNVLAVGAPEYGTGGGIIIWTRSGTLWTEQTIITVSTSRRLGFNGALSTDGKVLIASEGITLGVADEGVWVFEESGGVWIEKTTAPIIGQGTFPTEPLFGHALSISGDGSFALVGEPGRETTANNTSAGGVYSIC